MLVVDANIVTKWFVDQVHSDRAERVQTSKQRLVAPQLMIAEVTDALGTDDLALARADAGAMDVDAAVAYALASDLA